MVIRRTIPFPSLVIPAPLAHLELQAPNPSHRCPSSIFFFSERLTRFVFCLLSELHQTESSPDYIRRRAKSCGCDLTHCSSDSPLSEGLLREQKVSTCLFWFYLTASLVSCLTESSGNMVCVAAFRVVPSAVAHSFSPPRLPTSSLTGAVYSQKLFLYYLFFLNICISFPALHLFHSGLKCDFFFSSVFFLPR